MAMGRSRAKEDGEQDWWAREHAWRKGEKQDADRRSTEVEGQEVLALLDRGGAGQKRGGPEGH